MSFIRAANFVDDPLPNARTIIPYAYGNLGKQKNRGYVVQMEGAERLAAMDLEVEEIELQLSQDVISFQQISATVAQFGQNKSLALTIAVWSPVFSRE